MSPFSAHATPRVPSSSFLTASRPASPPRLRVPRTEINNPIDIKEAPLQGTLDPFDERGVSASHTHALTLSHPSVLCPTPLSLPLSPPSQDCSCPSCRVLHSPPSLPSVSPSTPVHLDRVSTNTPRLVHPHGRTRVLQHAASRRRHILSPRRSPLPRVFRAALLSLSLLLVFSEGVHPAFRSSFDGLVSSRVHDAERTTARRVLVCVCVCVCLRRALHTCTPPRTVPTQFFPPPIPLSLSIPSPTRESKSEGAARPARGTRWNPIPIC